MIRSSLICLLLILGVAPKADALQVLWQSSSMGIDLQSDGVMALDGTFQAEIGSFQTGFTPSFDNVAQWEANWRSFGTSTYNALSQEIRGSGDLADNNEFKVGERAYLWVWNSKTGPDAEWLLVSDEDWTWPQVNPLGFSFNLVLSQVSGAEIIFGRANQRSFQIQTMRPFRENWNYGTWVASEFTVQEQGDDAISGRNGDPDGDQINNLFEFVMGTNPKVKNFPEYAHPIIMSREGDTVVLEALRDPLAVVGLDIGVSTTLADQFPLELPGQTETSEWSDRRVYRFPFGVSEFFRVHIQE